MKYPEFDSDGYPTDATLEAIEQWSGSATDPRGLLAFVEEAWEYDGFIIDGASVEMHTGGWSGNESIVGALQRNTMFWSLYWQESKRGGHHRFTIPAVGSQQGAA